MWELSRAGVGACLIVAAIAFVALVPPRGRAEGAVRLVDCGVVKVCDASGACRDSATRVAFRLEPVQVAADGSGRYTVSYGDTKSAAQAFSDAGPFFWTVGDERNTLVASSERQFLWHRLALDGAPHATVSFLDCTFSR